MSVRFRTRKLTCSLKALFSSPKRNITQKRLLNRYYKQIWLSYKPYDALVILASANHLTRKSIYELVMEHGISHILGEAISENNGRGVAARKTGTNSKTIIFCNKVQRMGQVYERQNVLSIGPLICDDGFDLKRPTYLEIRLQRKVIWNVIERLWSVKRNLFEIDRLSVLSPFVELRVY